MFVSIIYYIRIIISNNVFVSILFKNNCECVFVAKSCKHRTIRSGWIDN